MTVAYNCPGIHVPLAVIGANGEMRMSLEWYRYFRADFNASGSGQVASLLSSSLASAKIFVGNASGVAAGVALSGDATINNAGVLTLAFHATPITNSLSGDVNLNNVSNYFDGPSVAQGSVGTWFVSGTVTVLDTAGAATFNAKLWDGTTVIASAQENSTGAGKTVTIALSGELATPAGNLRISVNDPTAATGAIKFNSSGNSKDSTITAIRIG